MTGLRTPVGRFPREPHNAQGIAVDRAASARAGLCCPTYCSACQRTACRRVPIPQTQSGLGQGLGVASPTWLLLTVKKGDHEAQSADGVIVCVGAGFSSFCLPCSPTPPRVRGNQAARSRSPFTSFRSRDRARSVIKSGCLRIKASRLASVKTMNTTT